MQTSRGIGLCVLLGSMGAAACVVGISGDDGVDKSESSVVAPNEPVPALPDAAPRRVCPSERDDAGNWQIVHGFDVSDYQFTDWDKVVAENPHQRFAFSRISAGLVRIDARFKIDWPNSKRVGLIRGAYQYFKPSQSAVAQANLYLEKMNAAGGLEATDFPPVLDIEAANEMPTDTIVCRLKKWLAVIENATGRVPLIYTSHNWSYLLDSSFARYPLWIANYVGTPSVTCPRMPASWDKWAIWQHSDHGGVWGVYPNGNRDDLDGGFPARQDGGDGGFAMPGCDVNYYDGTLAEMKAFIASTVSPGPVPDPGPLANPPQVVGAASVAGGPVDCADDGCCVPAP